MGWKFDVPHSSKSSDFFEDSSLIQDDQSNTSSNLPKKILKKTGLGQLIKKERAQEVKQEFTPQV
jgi:hypothetical protein